MANILVVGCGPTGLALAGILKSYGVDVTLIDKYPGVLKATKAAAIHARTLEVLDTLGCADRIVSEGQKVEYLNLRTHYEDRLIVKFADLPDTRYPFMIDLPQYRTEEILIDRLKEMGVPMRRSVELKDLVQHGDGVTVTLQPKEDDGKTDTGSEETLEFDYVIGCDGVHSAVRSKIGKDFAGESYADPWCLTDARMEWPIPRNEMTFSSDDTGICGMFPLPEEGHFRVVYTQWFDDKGKPIPPNRENMMRALARTGEKLPIVHDIGKFWTFDLDHRQVDSYRKDRVFLVGDAAHVHTPFGGQGMNLGICDAQNLAWKLAAVVNGLAGETLLASYNEERHPIAREVILLTHLGASAMLVRKGPKAALRDLTFNLLNLPDAFRHRMAERLSQLAHSYRGQHLFGGAVSTGDRLPDILFNDGYASSKHRLHERIKPGVLNVVLALSGTHEQSVDAQLGELSVLKRRSPVPLRISVYSRFPVADRGRFVEIDDWAYDRKAELGAAVPYDGRCFLVRPDSFVGARKLDVEARPILTAIDAAYARPAAMPARAAVAAE